MPPVPPPLRPPECNVDPVYRYVRRVEVRFRDLDILHHVNHVVFLTFVEQVRTQYLYDVLGIQVPSGYPAVFVIATVRKSMRWATSR